MCGKATLAACQWIQANHPDHPEYILSGNIDTDKKHSRINMLLTRGKRVVAEATIPDQLLQDLMGVDARPSCAPAKHRWPAPSWSDHRPTEPTRRTA